MVRSKFRSQGPVPAPSTPDALQKPSQPTNEEVPVGVAVKVTDVVPAGYVAEQVPLVVVPLYVQLIRGGVWLSVMVPVPLPSPATEILAGPKVAVTVVTVPTAPMVTVQEIDVAGHTVDDPFTVQFVSVEAEFAVGIAVKLTCCPGAKFAMQVLGHAIPPKVASTIPVPVTETMSGTPEAVATPVPETIKEIMGFLGSFVEKEIVPLMGPVLATGPNCATSKQDPSGGTDCGVTVPITRHSFVTPKPAEAVTLVMFRTLSPLFVMVINCGVPNWPCRTGPKFVSAAGETIATAASGTTRIRPLPESAMLLPGQI